MQTTSFDNIKQQAISIFQGNKRIKCPIFGEVRLTQDGFKHIEWKKKNHRRNPSDAFVRYICFVHVKDILEKSQYYQEYRETSEIVKVKRKGKRISEQKIVRYFAFVAVVNNNKNRVKVLVKKVDGWNHYDFVSIIPAWKSKGYNQVSFESTEKDVLESVQRTLDIHNTTKDETVGLDEILQTSTPEEVPENLNENNAKITQNSLDDFNDKVCTEGDKLNREIGTNPQTSPIE